MKLKPVKIVREILLMIFSFFAVLILFALVQKLPYKYNPLYYANNVFFINKLPANPLLVKSVFGKVGIFYRDDVVENGVIFFGQYQDKNSKGDAKKIVAVNEYIDAESFREIKNEESRSPVTFNYKDKNFSYVIYDNSDGISLHIIKE